MKKSEFKNLKASFRAMQLTPRRGVLDADKKLLVLQLIGSGLSRREAAQFVECAHTTIGRTAARDPEFAATLRQAESISHLQAVNAVRGAMRDPKYWRAAAWMLERRSPEEYAKRDPNSFTADQVMSLLARLYRETVPLLPAEKVAQFQELFDEALEEIEAKSGREERDDEPPDDKNDSTPRAAAGPSRNGHHRTDPPGNGHHGPEPAPGAETGSSNGKPYAEQVEQQVPLAEREEYVGPLAERAEYVGPLTEREEYVGPLAEREEYVGPLAEREGYGAPNEVSDVDKLLAGGRFAGRPANCGAVVRRFDPAQLHQPLQRGAASAAEDVLPKALNINDLHHQSTNCTTPDNIEGRCNKTGGRTELAGAT